MRIDIDGIVALVGNYGSGKTEVTINLGVEKTLAGIDVRIADLDLVNPYFRTREVKQQFLKIGIDLVLPPEKYLHADLPVLSPKIAGMLRKPDRLTLMDCGGDNVGAAVLGCFADLFTNQHVHLLQVINPFRPFTNTVEKCFKIRDEIEKAAKMPILSIVGNANLVDETDVDDIYMGYDFINTVSKLADLPVSFITAAADLLPALDMGRFCCPVLPIKRQLTMPWHR